MSKVIAVQTTSYTLPVGSLITTTTSNGEAKNIFYRNINEKHILRKKDYSAICMDEKVVTYLSTNDKPVEVVYDFTGDQSGTYRTTFENYEKAKTVKMGGRLQRPVSLSRFVFEPKRTYYQRPTETVFV